MTKGTIFVGGYMIIVFTEHCCAIVTGIAVVRDILVAKICLRKYCRYMTHRAIFGGGYMVWISFGIFSGRGNPVMAGCTVANNTGMVEDGWRKSTCYVAYAAILGS